MYDPNAFYTPPQPEYYPRYPAPPAPAKTRSVPAMVFMILSFVCLAASLGIFIYYCIRYTTGYEYEIDSDPYVLYSVCVMGGHVLMLGGAALMMSGMIIGNRGYKLVGAGLLLMVPVCLIRRLVYTVMYMGSFLAEDYAILQILAGIVLINGVILSGVGCLARIKGLKLTGAILMLNGFCFSDLLIPLVFQAYYPEWTDVVYTLGVVLAAVAVILYPVRRRSA